MFKYLFILMIAFAFPSKSNDKTMVDQKEFEQLNLLLKTSIEIQQWEQSNQKQLNRTKEVNYSMIKTIILD